MSATDRLAAYRPEDFPPSRRWQRTVALANRSCLHAYKRSRGELNFREVVAILDADDKCRAYLKASPRLGPEGDG